MGAIRYVVFGGNGQLGSELESVSKCWSLELVALGKSDVDVTEPEAVRQALDRFAPHIVVNAAAYAHVDAAEQNCRAAWDVNCRGAGAVASACAAAQIPLIHISTDYVFDGVKGSPYTETDAVAPLSVYGCSKEAGERAVRDACCKHLILRTAWLYGRYGTNFLKTIARLALEQSALRVVADQYGSPTATKDLASAIFVAGTRALGNECPWGTYHFAGSKQASRHEFASEIVKAQARWTGKLPAVIAISTAEYSALAKRPVYAMLNSDKFYSAFGVRAAPWQSRLPLIIEAILLNRAP